MDLFFPPGSANLWPGNRGAIYLLCSMLRIIWDVRVHVELVRGRVRVHDGGRTVVNTTMQNPDARWAKS